MVFVASGNGCTFALKRMLAESHDRPLLLLEFGILVSYFSFSRGSVAAPTSIYQQNDFRFPCHRESCRGAEQLFNM
jgi:hypothetical protein